MSAGAAFVASAIDLGDRARSIWYDGYVEQLVHHDVSGIAEVRSAIGLAAVLRAVALNTAGMPSISAVAGAAELDHRTVRAYLGILEELRIIERIPSWGVNRFRRAVKTPKYYVIDPGMAAQISGDSAEGVLSSADRMGRLLDTLVAAQLRPLLRLSFPAVTAHHLRDGNGEREVDLVLEAADGRIVGLEIRAAAGVTSRDARHLAWLRDQIGSSFVRGVVLHTGPATFPLGEKLWAMPIATLWRAARATN